MDTDNDDGFYMIITPHMDLCSGDLIQEYAYNLVSLPYSWSLKPTLLHEN